MGTLTSNIKCGDGIGTQIGETRLTYLEDSRKDRDMAEKNKEMVKKAVDYKTLLQGIGSILSEGRRAAAGALNNILVQTYWNIGRYIVEYEQEGNAKADYGAELLLRLSKDLTVAYGKGFSKSNLVYMRKLYLTFPKSETLSHQLSWSHYFEILKADSELEIGFYIKECEKENWSVRELKRQMKSMLFHRIALSKDKETVLEMSKKGEIIEKPEDLIKDPYVLEFLNISERDTYKEGELEDRIYESLKDFILELGRGFAYVDRQYVMQIGSRRFKVDLVFYNYILKCFFLIDLKRGEIEHKDVGQMNMYLNYVKKEITPEGDNPPVGLILGAYKDELLMEYALEGIENNLFVSKYQLYLPNKDELRKELSKLIEQDETEE